MPRGQTKHEIVAALLCASAIGCAPTATGGAVELSWQLRPASGPRINSTGPFINCDSGEPDTNPVTAIQLTWQVGDIVSSPPPSWDCNDNHGVTGFDLPEGQALITIAPVCVTGPADPNTFVAPAPIERQVIVGDTISLGAVDLVLEVSSCAAQPCICHP